jgi:hypothetical protein
MSLVAAVGDAARGRIHHRGLDHPDPLLLGEPWPRGHDHRQEGVDLGGRVIAVPCAGSCAAEDTNIDFLREILRLFGWCRPDIISGLLVRDCSIPKMGSSGAGSSCHRLHEPRIRPIAPGARKRWDRDRCIDVVSFNCHIATSRSFAAWNIWASVF